MPVPDFGPFSSDLNFSPAQAGQAACFALLDDCTATPAHPSSRLYTAYAGMLSCTGGKQLPALLSALQQALEQGWHAVLLLDYELGQMGANPCSADELTPASSAQGRALLFADCRLLDAAGVQDWLSSACDNAFPETDAEPAGISRCRASVDEPAFRAALKRIHAYLRAGDSYQVNYTYRLQAEAYGSPAALYQRLRARQPVPYGALIGLPDGASVLSLSPELFVRHEQGVLTARPMKGTAAASAEAQRNAAAAQALASDPKTRAENLMIVDLLRNDLGRIALPGSVAVPDLFTVEQHGDVLQVTSTITACLRPELSLAQVLEALYPCGSITGAPKRRTMQIIDELETTPRGLYTGAIGWLQPPATVGELGDFCLSVPIRTLSLQAPDPFGIRAATLGVGAGIVHDSDPAAEYEECRLKARFLTGLQPDFELFETMHATREQGCRHLERHLQRLRASAAWFGFVYDQTALRTQLQRTCANLPAATVFRLRLTLQPDGRFRINTAPLAPLSTPVQILLGRQAPPVSPLFLQHKSSVRYHYDAAWRFAEQNGAFDVVFCNARGHLTEGARSSLFVRLGERWYTPPLSAGVLPGVLRSVLLEDPAWQAEERELTLADLHRADALMVCNALRGAIPALLNTEVAWPGPGPAPAAPA